MILTCENCQTRYLVPNHAIGPDGRHVKCTVCSNEWFQEPDAPPDQEYGNESEVDAPSFEPPEDLEPIPDAVKPIPEGSSVPALPGEHERKKTSRGRLAGCAAAAVVFFAIFGGLVTMRTTVVHMWPPSAMLFDVIGMPVAVAGEGLILDRIKAVAEVNEDGVNVLNVEGTIINLKSRELAVPPLQTALRTADGKVYDSWKIEPEQDRIAPQGEMSFKTSYPDVPNDVREVNIRFMLVH